MWEGFKKSRGDKASLMKNKQKAVQKGMLIAELSKAVCNLILLYILRWCKRRENWKNKKWGKRMHEKEKNQEWWQSAGY